MLRKLCHFVALLASAQFASAAHITIDDTDIDNYTVSWHYFEGGITVNGSAYAGIATGSATFADTVLLQLDGLWIDLGAVAGQSGNFDLGADLSAPGVITSALTFSTGPGGGGYANIELDFYAYTGSVVGGGPTSYFQGDVLNYSRPFLGIVYLSEGGVAVPAPGAFALFGLGLLALGRRSKI